MVIAYQFWPYDASLAIHNSAVTTIPAVFPAQRKWYLNVFLYPFQANGFSPKQTPLKRYHLPSTSTSFLSPISRSITLNYLCITLGTLSQHLILTTKFSGPGFKPVSVFVPILPLSDAVHDFLSSPMKRFSQWSILLSL